MLLTPSFHFASPGVCIDVAVFANDGELRFEAVILEPVKCCKLPQSPDEMAFRIVEVVASGSSKDSKGHLCKSESDILMLLTQYVTGHNRPEFPWFYFPAAGAGQSGRATPITVALIGLLRL